MTKFNEINSKGFEINGKEFSILGYDGTEADLWLDDEKFGTLEFDEEQNAWVLWTSDINDGVTYFESYEETIETIVEEEELRA